MRYFIHLLRRCAGELCDSPKLKWLGREDMLWLPQFSLEQYSHYPLSTWLFMLNGSPTAFGSPPQLRENEHKPRKQRWFFTSSRKQQCWEELPDDSYDIIAEERDKMIKKRKERIKRQALLVRMKNGEKETWKTSFLRSMYSRKHFSMSNKGSTKG